MRKAAFLTAILLFVLPLWSQTLDFRNYTSADGLAVDEIYGLYQDKKGYLWVMTRYGVLKYNGSEFRPVLQNLPKKDAFIYCMYENKDGRKWVANSNARIYEIRHDSAFQLKGIEDISESLRNAVSEIYELHVDDSLNITAVTKAKCYKFRPKNGSYTATELNKFLDKPDSVYIKICEEGSDMYGLYQYYNGYEFLPRKEGLANYFKMVKSGRMIRIPGAVNYYIFRSFRRYNSDIYFYRLSTLGKITEDGRLKFIPIGGQILDYVKDKNDHTWVACLNDGIYELNEHDSIIDHYLEHTTVNCVLRDKQSGLWASTPENGLFYCANVNDKYFEKGSPLNAQISLIKKIDNRLFIANKKGDLFLMNKDTTLQLRKADNNTPVAITRNHDQYFILNTYFTESFDLAGHFKQLTPDRKNKSRYDLFAKNDTIIYTWRRGIVFLVKNKEVKWIDFNRKILSAALVGNNLWLGTEDGVFTCKAGFSKESQSVDGGLIPDKEELIRPDGLSDLQNIAVYKIRTDPSGNVWFCTHGEGLFRYRQNSLKQFSTDNDLPETIINSISFSDSGLVFLSTSNGLYTSTLQNTPSASGTFGSWSKIYNGEIREAIDFNGKIYLTCRSGLVILDQDRREEPAKGLFFNLNSISVDQKEINPKLFTSIDHKNTTITFKFDVITFSNKKPAVYYVLSGPVRDSNVVSNPVIRLSRLLPGDYVLTAYPYVSNGKTLKITVPFSVKPAFWQTTLFKVSAVVFILLLILLIMWLIIRIIKRRADVKTRNEQLILEYKLIALKAQINPHFISNCLSAIQNLILSDKTENATFYVARFGLLVRQILNFSSRSTITLAEELELLDIYVSLERLRFEDSFSFICDVEPGISLKKTHIPSLLLNPIVENAIWHGLLPLPPDKKGKLEISVKSQDERLIISVTDNGVGRSAKKSSLSNSNESSYGISITEQRLLNINYLYKNANAEMIYNDLSNADNSPGGTQVIFYLPLDLPGSAAEKD